LGEGYRYGCDIERGAWLARAVVDAGYKLGLCYSLGSQVMDPVMYDEAFLLMREVMYRARFMIDMICVGGGFPGFYDGMYPPMLNDYCSVIKRGLSRLHLPRTCRVLATPGRYLVNDAVSVLVRVEQRRGQMLYVNDGLMGSLGSINVPWWRPTVRLVRTNGRPARELDRYLLSGPAGYGNDTMPGPYYLPEDARPGDYLELGQLGAYSGCMTTAFQCIPWPDMVTVSDDPMTPAREDEMPQDMDEPITDEADEEPPYERGGGDEEGEYDEGDDYDDPGQLPRRR
jgi:ornithine decarboxylase